MVAKEDTVVNKAKQVAARKPVAAKKQVAARKQVAASRSTTHTQIGTGFFKNLFKSDKTDVRDAPMPSSKPRSVDVVIARYNEPDIELLYSKIPTEYNIIIYNKGPIDNLVVPEGRKGKVDVINLKNVGRCDHTYLHHIVTNFKKLADVTIFIVASALDDSMYKKSAKLKVVLDCVSKSYTSAFPVMKPVPLKKLYNFSLEKYTATNKANKALNPQNQLQLCSIRPFGKWYEEVFKGLKVPELMYVNVNAIFAVDKEHIHNRPLSLYKHLITYVDKSSNPEAGHYMERTWTSLFYPFPDYCLRKYNNSSKESSAFMR